jgi:catechol 2,3-dioxygenase
MASPETSASSRPDVLPAALRLGPVELTVTDLDRSVAWYEQALGLRSARKSPVESDLGDGRTTVVRLVEDRGANAAGRHAGLYHYALLFPTREELARALLRVAAAQTPVQGLSDHRTHEAVYLADPDGNGIELAADRPREDWPADAYADGPAPLDVAALLATVEGESPSANVREGVRVGHVHLHVGDIGEALAFYRDVLGFELQANLGTAVFLSAGGYHHHVGLNVWKGHGVGPAPAHTVGLRSWTILLPSPGDVDAVRARVDRPGLPLEPRDGGFQVRDPWQISVDVVCGSDG